MPIWFKDLRVFLLYLSIFALYYSPALLSDNFLCSLYFDGIAFHFPAIYGDRQLIELNTLCGYPNFVDPQQQFYYPLAWVASCSQSFWNWYVLLPLILAAFFTYRFTYDLTESTYGAFVAGLFFGFCPFFYSHIHHLCITHSCCWFPLALHLTWKIFKHPQVFLILRYSFVLSLIFLGGHPQIYFFSCMIIAISSVFWFLEFGLKARAVVALGFGTVLSILLVAVQLLPTMEMTQIAGRKLANFDFFVAHSLPANHWPMLTFPASYGSTIAEESETSITKFLNHPYIGEGNSTEISLYPGWTLLFLLASTSLFWRRNHKSFAWCFIAIFAIFMAVGEATPLANLLFKVPILNKFRCLARIGFAWYLSLSVLAAFAISYLQNEQIQKNVNRSILIWHIVFLLGFILLGLKLYKKINNDAFFLSSMLPDESFPSMVYWLSILVPGLCFTALSIVMYLRSSVSPVLYSTFFSIVLILDLTHPAWLFGQVGVCEKQLLQPVLFPQFLRETTRHPTQRFQTPPNNGPKNLNTIFGIPEATGYQQLVPNMFSQVLNSPVPVTPALAKIANIQSFHIFQELESRFGYRWLKQEMTLPALGTNIDAGQKTSLTFQFPSQSVDRLGLITILGSSIEVPDGTPMAEIDLTDEKGKVHTFRILAGRDTCEWAASRDDVKPALKHSLPVRIIKRPIRAKPFGTFFSIYSFCEFVLPETTSVLTVSIRYIGPANSVVQVFKVTLQSTRSSDPDDFPLDTSMLQSPGWQTVMDTSHQPYASAQFPLRFAKLLQDARIFSEDIIRGILKSSLTFDPDITVLLDQQPNISLGSPDSTASVEIETLDPLYQRYKTTSTSNSIFVDSIMHYPCWTPYLDGNPVLLIRTNGLMRGIEVPSGEHTIEFHFSSRTLQIGKILSTITLILIIVIGVWLYPANKRLAVNQ